MSYPGLRPVLGAAALTTFTFLTAPALAADVLEVKDGEEVVLDGTVRFKSVHVRKNGILRVRPVTDAAPESGSLTIKAGTIEVDEGGTIDASGAGFPGTEGAGAAPSCCPSASGAQGLSGTPTAPGGGGGSGGKGAPGCVTNTTGTGGPGGQAYANPESMNAGAAGGAAFFDSSSEFPNRGGRGGGVLVLVAGIVEVNGRILANGAPGLPFGGTGTGGGAGGSISIDAVSVVGDGKIEARGGDGSPAFYSSGGGGGGGVIFLRVATALATDSMGGTLPSQDVRGGETNATSTACLDGDPGVLQVDVDATKCIDADGDGVTSELCQGNDCDDADPTVFGGANPALEICDGQDNDCNNAIDDDLVTDACPAGQSCQGGACEADGAGGSGDGGGSNADEAPPDYLAYRGSCSMDGSMRAAHANGAAFFAAALAAFLIGMRARRRK